MFWCGKLWLHHLYHCETHVTFTVYYLQVHVCNRCFLMAKYRSVLNKLNSEQMGVNVKKKRKNVNLIITTNFAFFSFFCRIVPWKGYMLNTAHQMLTQTSSWPRIWTQENFVELTCYCQVLLCRTRNRSGSQRVLGLQGSGPKQWGSRAPSPIKWGSRAPEHPL